MRRSVKQFLNRIDKSTYYTGLILAIIILGLFYPVVFEGKTFGTPDSLSPRAGSIILNKTWTETGVFPLWQPWIFSGMPTAEAFSFISSLYFPSLVLGFLLNGTLIQLLHLLFAGLGCYLLVKKLTENTWAAILAGASFMTMPFMITMIVFGHGSQMMTAAYIPWVFLFTHKLLAKPNLADAGILALLLGFQLQRAHVQIAYYSWLLVGAFVFWHIGEQVLAKQPIRDLGKPFGYFLLSAVLAIGIALIVYYPSLPYADYSVRGAGSGGGAQYDYATAWSFHPLEMATFILPSAYGFGGQTYWGHMPFTDYPNFMGLLVLILAIIGAIKNRTSLTNFLIISSLLALMISFGKHFSLIYNVFFDYFPFFNKFRVPSMILILVQFNTAILAGLGLKSLLNESDGWMKPVKYGSGILGILFLGLMFGNDAISSWLSGLFRQPAGLDSRTVQVLNSMRLEMWFRDAWIGLVLLIVFTAGFWAYRKKYINAKIFIPGLVVLSLIDISVVDWNILVPSRNSGRQSQIISEKMVESYFSPDEIITFLQSDGRQPFRIYPLGPWFGESRFRAFGLESVGGYHPAKLKNYNEFLTNTNNAASLPLLAMLNVKYVISPQALSVPGLSLAKSGKLRTNRGMTGAFVYELNASGPRAWFLDSLEIGLPKESIWQNIQAENFDPFQKGYTTYSGKLPGTFSRGSIISTDFGIHQSTIQVDCPSQGFLVVSEINYPLRWKAAIDGDPVETIEINGILRGVLVQAGQHSVTFEYDRSAFNTGIILSILAFAGALGLIGFAFIKNRKNR